MRTYIVRIIRLNVQPVRVFAQRTFDAQSRLEAEGLACIWAYENYGGHPENYDAQAVLLCLWQTDQAPGTFSGHFA